MGEAAGSPGRVHVPLRHCQAADGGDPRLGGQGRGLARSRLVPLPHLRGAHLLAPFLRLRAPGLRLMPLFARAARKLVCLLRQVVSATLVAGLILQGWSPLEALHRGLVFCFLFPLQKGAAVSGKAAAAESAYPRTCESRIAEGRLGERVFSFVRKGRPGGVDCTELQSSRKVCGDASYWCNRFCRRIFG